MVWVLAPMHIFCTSDALRAYYISPFSKAVLNLVCIINTSVWVDYILSQDD